MQFWSATKLIASCGERNILADCSHRLYPTRSRWRPLFGLHLSFTLRKPTAWQKNCTYARFCRLDWHARNLARSNSYLDRKSLGTPGLSESGVNSKGLTTLVWSSFSLCSTLLLRSSSLFAYWSLTLSLSTWERHCSNIELVSWTNCN